MDFQSAALFDLPSLADVLRVTGFVLAAAAVSATAAVVAWVRAESRPSGAPTELDSLDKHIARH
jgi:hypothetical protein